MAGMLLALADDAAPTEVAAANAAWRAVGGLVVVVAAAFATPAFVIASAVLAAVSSSEPLLIAVGALGVGIGALGAWRWPDVEAVGATVGLCIVAVVYRLPHDSPMGLSTLVAVVVVIPALLGAWRWGPVWFTRTLGSFAGLLILVAVVAGVGFVFAGLRAQSQLEDASSAIELAADRFGDGDEDGARSSLEAALADVRGARDGLDEPWLAPLPVLPVFSQHEALLDTIAVEADRTVEATLALLDDLDGTPLSLSGGRIDLDAIRAIAPGLADLADATETAERELEDARSRWLVGPASSALDDGIEEVRAIAADVRKAASAVELAPGLFGGNGLRTHLVLFATPAELRGSVGLVGNWALLEAEDGELRLTGVGRASDLNDALEQAPVTLSEPEGYIERYGANSVESEFQDVTLSPHFPDVADVAAQLFLAATGTEVSSVILVDPTAVEAMLRIAGPVNVRGQTVTANSVVSLLLVDQYTMFAEEEDRVEFLAVLLAAAFDQMLGAELPDPWALDDVFGDVVDQDRLLMASTDPDELALLEELGLTGSFPPRDVDDIAALVIQNAGQNKIDTFLGRSMRHRVHLDTDTGVVTATTTVRLENTVQDLSGPDALVGNNDQGYPRGTNVAQVVLYTPHRLRAVTVDGRAGGAQARDEFGLRSYSLLVEIPPGGVVELDFTLEGQMPVEEGRLDRYVLAVPVQPAVNPLRIDLEVTDTTGGLVNGGSGTWSGGAADLRDQRFEFDLSPSAG